MLLPPPPQQQQQPHPAAAAPAGPLPGQAAASALPGDGHHVSEAIYAGVPLPHAVQHALGATAVQPLHAHSVAPAAISAAPAGPPQLELERRDPLTSSTITLEFVSFAPSNALNVPRNLENLYMRFRFFDFPPTQTPKYVLDKPQQPTHPSVLVRSCTWATSCSEAQHTAKNFIHVRALCIRAL